jgi:hypothetical protein
LNFVTGPILNRTRFRSPFLAEKTGNFGWSAADRCEGYGCITEAHAKGGGATFLGTVGLNWQVAGVSNHAAETT